LVAVLTMALGMGANTAIFNVFDAVLLRTLPVPDPQRLVMLTDPDAHGRWFGGNTGERSILAYSEFEFLRDHNDVFSSSFAADSSVEIERLSIGGSPQAAAEQNEMATVRLVSGSYFSTLGVQPSAGRLFTPEMDRARGGAPYAVLSYAFWKNRFALDSAILGKTVRIRQTAFEIIGVTAPGFLSETVGSAPDLWVPLMMQDAIYPGRDLLASTPTLVNIYLWLQMMGRLKPGVTLEQAQAHIDVEFKRYLESAAAAGMSDEQRRHVFDVRIKLQSGARGASTLHQSFGDPLKMLMALVGLVLLMACANIANLLLARGATRRKEFAVRIALGAGRTRLLRQLLTESLLIAALGAVAGLMLAQWADALLVRLASGGSPGASGIHLDLHPDARVLGFTFAVASLTAILFGLFPALRAARLDLTPALKSTAPGQAEAGAPRFLSPGKILVIGQVALSLILLVAAGLFVRSLRRLSEVNLGYRTENLVLFNVDVAPGGYKGDAVLRQQRELLDKFSAIPGVRLATASSNGLFMHSESGDPIAVDGYTPKAGEELQSRMDHVGPGYFSAVGIPILAGREIGPQDLAGKPRVAVINQSFATAYFANSSPLGKIVRDTYPGNPGEAEVVGVVADSKLNSLREPASPRIYFPIFNPMWEHTAAAYELRTQANPAGVIAAVRKIVAETNPAFPPLKIETLTELVADSLNTDRFITQLTGGFGVLALLLASIGLYGLMAYTVARRTRDIGIRMALGAQRGSVLRSVLGETLLLVALGIAVGAPAVLGGTQLIRSMLFGVGLADPVAIVFAMGVLAGVAALAGYLPARRAARVDPMIALRYE
ncbi:MAG TPA: ABC transporter permease, partial [Candidatus Acidoferrales bacterium]|nr:ABC transporter permease [Candidatus Acidoferrales bacterium]